MTIVRHVNKNGRVRRRGLITIGNIAPSSRTCRILNGDRNTNVTTFGQVAENIRFEKRLEKAKQQRRRESILKVLETERAYQLYLGDAPFGKPKIMTGYEAKEKNDALEDKFFRDKSPDARMWRWISTGTK